jgi:hypothetical protein
MDKNVKGSIFIEVVKRIKKDKSGVYKKYLTNEDWDVISQNLLPSSWYPYEPYKNCLKAIFKVVAKNDLEVAKEWGRTSCQAVMTGIYASVLKKKCDPLSFIKQYDTTYRNFYDFGQTVVIAEGKNGALYQLSDFDEQFALVYYAIQGWIERGLELCGAKNVSSEFVTKSWEGKPFTSIRFTWT